MVISTESRFTYFFEDLVSSVKPALCCLLLSGSAVSKDGGCPFFALCELRKIPTNYSAIFDIFDLMYMLAAFCFSVVVFFTIYLSAIYFFFLLYYCKHV